MKHSRIALVGRSGSGKDFLASQLLDFNRVAFGDPIRLVLSTLRAGYPRMALAMLEQLTSGMLTRVHLRTLLGHIATVPKEGPKDRKGLQELGTLINKSLEGVWIRAGLMKAGGFPKVVFTDVRRGSEFKALRDSGYYLIGIKAPERVRFERLAERDGITWEDFETMEQHQAESEIDVLIAQCDSIIHNVEKTRGFTALEQLETIIQGGNGKQ